jgi:hypothetical protein
LGLLERIDAARGRRGGEDEQRFSIDQWIGDYLLPANEFGFQGVNYPFGLNQTWTPSRAKEIATTLPGYMAALRGCPPAFGAQLVRASALSQARFCFRNADWSPKAGRTFTTSALGPLQKPWTNATTGQLINIMEWHEGLAGNAYVTNRTSGRLRVLRPDWVMIVYGSQQQPEDAAHALDGELIGYMYCNGGFAAGRYKPEVLLPDEVAHWCADEATEILTAEGWKDYTSLKAGDEVLTLNHETGLSEWQPVIEKMVFPALRREMVSMEGSEFSSLTTPNHRWPAEYRISRAKTYGRRWVTSATIGAGDRIPVAAHCADLPTEPKWSDALVETVAWFWTEGRFASGRKPGTKGRGISIAQSAKNADNVARIRAALWALLGAPVARMPKTGPRAAQLPCWRESADDDMVIFRLSANAADIVTAQAPGKVVSTEFLRSLTAAQLELFIHVSMLADNNGKSRLGQKNPAMAEQFALACILAGRAVSIREGAHKKRGYRMTNVRMLRKRHVYPQESSRTQSQFRIRRVEYDGHVWCPRTENQTWLARRAGSVYFTGNSPLPDPECAGIGMSWITPAVREIQGDRLASDHKIKFFENSATPSMVVKGLAATSRDQFNDLVDMMETRHAGVRNAYRTLYLTAGADATVVGSDLRQLDFKATVGTGETRISLLSRVHPVILGASEGLSGSSLNAGNFGAARRIWADTWIYPTLQDLAAALSPMVRVPGDAELWTNTRGMPVLREDAKDAAEIEAIKASTIVKLTQSGFTRESAVAAVMAEDMTLLKEDPMWVSVQLQQAGLAGPGQPALPAPKPAPALPAGGPK